MPNFLFWQLPEEKPFGKIGMICSGGIGFCRTDYPAARNYLNARGMADGV